MMSMLHSSGLPLLVFFGPSAEGLLMLVQMELDVQSYVDKAWALELESISAQTAWNNARAAVRQARRALRDAPADQDLKEKLQLAKEDEGKANEYIQQVEEQLRVGGTGRLGLIAMLGGKSEASALLLSCWLADCLWASSPVNA